MARKKADKQIDEQTEAAASIAAKPSDASKASLMVQGYAAMAAMDKSTLAQVLAQIGNEAKDIPDGAAAQNAASIQAKGKATDAVTQAMKEDFDELFGGLDLSEDFKGKAKTIFEATLHAQAVAIEASLIEQYEQQYEQDIQEAVQNLEDQVDRYITLAAETFIQKNELAVEQSIRTEMAQSMLKGLYNLFAEHNTVVPESEIDALEAALETVEDLKAQYNEQIENNLKLAEIIESYEQKKVFDEVSEGLALTQKDKLATLAEGIEYDSIDEFKTKLTTLKETTLSAKPVKAAPALKEVELFEDAADEKKDQKDLAEQADPRILSYAKAISRTLGR